MTNIMRQIVLDTETTGLDFSSGHRLVEIGCLEIINRKLTGRKFHTYLNPQFEVDKGAFETHGLSNQFLADKPLFSSIAKDFMSFIAGAELIIHNAPFDIGFINNELRLDANKYGLITNQTAVIDTLVMGRNMFPGQRNSLDALCKRFGVENAHRELHGALLDAQLLAEVYLLMTGGQTGLELGAGSNDSSGNQKAESIQSIKSDLRLVVIDASIEEEATHAEYLEFLQKKSKQSCIWLK